MINQFSSETVIIQYDDYPVVPWKNGQGVTRSILQYEPDDSGFVWRLSLADVSQSGAFSDFGGYDRTITLLDGAGFDLDFADGRSKTLETLHAPYDFDGGDPLYCTLRGGPSKDLNVMTRQGDASVQWRVVNLDKPMTVTPKPDVTRLLFCFSGRIQLVDKTTGTQCELKKWGIVLLGDHSILRLSNSPDTTSTVFDISISNQKIL